MNLISEHIHLWHIALDTEISCTELFLILSIDEQQKANSFHFEKDKNNYIKSHAALRKILSKYYFINPIDICFSYTKYNKPYISDNQHNLHFNLSHSNDMAIVAIIKNHPLGVDVEYIKPVDDINDIVENFFSNQEKIKFLLLPGEKKLEAFYTIWTRKEAFVKAVGNGLSYPLDDFEVSFLENEPARILKVNDSEIEAKRWSLNGFTFQHANNCYITAIATKSRVKNIIRFYYAHKQMILHNE